MNCDVSAEAILLVPPIQDRYAEMPSSAVAVVHMGVLVVASVRAQQPHFIRFLIMLSVKMKKITAKVKSKLSKSSSEAESVILVTFFCQILKRKKV
jgi:hypothetical protein